MRFLEVGRGTAIPALTLWRQMFTFVAMSAKSKEQYHSAINLDAEIVNLRNTFERIKYLTVNKHGFETGM